MSAKLSTFGQTEEHISTFEQTAPMPTTEPTAETIADEPATTEPIAEPTPAAELTEVDYSTSSFSLGGDEPSAEPQAVAPAAQPQFNLDEELKKVDKKEIAKKIGLNEFVLELNDHLANGGSALDYLNARAIDYTKVSDENIIKSDFQKQYPNLSQPQIDLLYKRRYSVDEDIASDEDKQFVEIQKSADAQKIRQQLIETQKQFKIPDAITPVKDEAYEQWKQNRDSQNQLVEQANSYYLNHAATKSLHENKKVAINVGEGFAPFNVAIDKPELITRSFTDNGETWQKLTSTPTGEPDVQKQQLISLFTFNPQKFVQDVFNYGLQQGKRTLVAEGQNAQRPQTPVLPMNPDQKPTYGTGTFGSKPR